MTTINLGYHAYEQFVKLLQNNHHGNPFSYPMTEVDQYELSTTPFGSCQSLYEQWAYCNVPNVQYPIKGMIYLYPNGRGVFIVNHYDGKYSIDKPYPKLKIHFFKFGCSHIMQRTRNLGNCYNEFTCEVCGYTEKVDSSD
jgi:hypothetical protein